MEVFIETDRTVPTIFPTGGRRKKTEQVRMRLRRAVTEGKEGRREEQTVREEGTGAGKERKAHGTGRKE